MQQYNLHTFLNILYLQHLHLTISVTPKLTLSARTLSLSRL
jgi:hypothetical protein